jgi:O-antigen ligase
MVCGLACIISWLKFIKEKEKYMRIALLGSIFAMSLGVIISTSRSAVLGLIGVFLIFSLRKNGFYKTIFVCFIMIMFTIFTYLLIDGFANGTQFQIKLKERFIEEPLTAIYSSQGKRYSQETHGSGEWREESAINGLNVFLQFPLNEKLFGIGTGGYVIRNYSEGLQPHNGYLLLFIERGLIGGLIFCALLFSLIKYYSKIKPNSINMLLIVFMLFYSLPQNSELTSGLMVLLIGSEIAERFTLTGRFN